MTSYGEVATVCGYPRHSRLVGSVLKSLTDADHLPQPGPDADADADVNDEEAGAEGEAGGEAAHSYGEVPWWRVVNGRGIISPRESGVLSVNRQADRLRAEGVAVDAAPGEEVGNGGSVNLFLYAWDFAGVVVPQPVT